MLLLTFEFRSALRLLTFVLLCHQYVRAAFVYLFLLFAMMKFHLLEVHKSRIFCQVTLLLDLLCIRLFGISDACSEMSNWTFRMIFASCWCPSGIQLVIVNRSSVLDLHPVKVKVS